MADSRRVLVVEDDVNENEFLSLTARGLGFTVDSAFDGQQALEMAGKAKPNLILLDALLPKLDGFGVLAELRQRMPEVPVIMMSGIYKKRTYEAEALRQGATMYLVKPISIVTVWDSLERFLGTGEGGLPKDFPGVPFWRRPLPAVVADLHVGRKTGLLFVRGNGGSAILFFEDGTLVFARCNDASTRLDRILLKSGKIPPTLMPQLSELVANSKGIRLGELLVQEGLLDEETVREALAEQQRVHLMRPFTWTEGACHFFPTEAPRQETFKLPVDVPALVFWGCRNLPIDDTLIRWLPGTSRKLQVNVPVAELGVRFTLSPEECQLVALLDGTRTMGQIRSVARLLGVDGERVLAGLHALQLLQVSEITESSVPGGMSGASLPVAGDIAKFGPALLLVTAALARKTGILQVESTQPPGQTRTIWVENGALAFVSSNDPGDRLGQVLLREGLLAREQLQQALAAAQDRPGIALGRVLVDLGLLGPDDLHRGLVLQAQHGVATLLGWRAGTFQFQERALPVKEIVPLGLDTRLILMAAFRSCPFTDLMGKLPPPLTRLRRSAACHELASDLPLTALEDRVLIEVDGETTMQDLASKATEGKESILRTVHALMSMGLLEGLAPAAGSAAPSSPARAQEALAGEPPSNRARVMSEEFDVLPERPEPTMSAYDAPIPAQPARVEPGFREAAFSMPTTVATGASTDMFGDIPLDGGLEDMLLAVPPAEASPAIHAAPQAPRPHAAAPATATTTGSATATAVAEAPRPASSPMGQAQQIVQLSQFLELLSSWLEVNPGTVPESVLTALPADVRQLFRL